MAFYNNREVQISLWDTEMWDTSFNVAAYRCVLFVVVMFTSLLTAI